MPLSVDFSGKLILLTGGGRGIGLAITTALAKAGADVAITYTSKDATPVAEELSKKHGVRVRAYKCEVSQSSDVDKAVEQVQKDWGKQIDIGVANAGITLWQEAESNSDEDFKHIYDVNTFGPFYLARALVRSWRSLPITVDGAKPSGSTPTNLNKQIFFVSSVSGLVAMTPQKQTAYNSSKAALTMLAKSLAAEWGSYGVTVNCVSPGYVSTDMIANPPDEEAKEWVKEWSHRTPVGRFATPDEIGEAIVMLLSDKLGGMGWMTGSDVVIDGGYTLH